MEILIDFYRLSLTYTFTNSNLNFSTYPCYHLVAAISDTFIHMAEGIGQS